MSNKGGWHDPQWVLPIKALSVRLVIAFPALITIYLFQLRAFPKIIVISNQQVCCGFCDDLRLQSVALILHCSFSRHLWILIVVVCVARTEIAELQYNFT